MTNFRKVAGWWAVMLVGGGWTCPAQEPATVPPTQLTAEEAHSFFDEKIKPILSQRCWGCHGEKPDDLAGGLNLAQAATIWAGGDSGPAVNREQPAASLLLDAINYGTYEMPPDGKLPPDEIALLTQWVQLGIPWGSAVEFAAAGGGPTTKAEPEVNDETRQWWSFQPIRQPSLPAVQNTAWPRNAIDHFVLARLEAAGLQPAAPASREVLIRRATYDLLGLPPTAAEVDRFLADQHPDAFAHLIDRLLASPHYGERWGRHWLDLVRYAESNSFERDGTKPFVWRYRDYVIQALNDDVPYDQFVTEQLAGDELPEVTPRTLIATGYYRLGAWDDEPADPLQARYDDLDDILATTGQTMLGLTVNCARCHNHKIDPIPQSDYYRLLGFFHNIRRYGVRAEETVNEASVRTLGQAASAEQQEAYQQQLAELTQRIEELERRVKADFIPVEHQEFQYPLNRVPLVAARVGKLITAEELAAYQEWTRQLHALKNQPPAGETKVLCVKEAGAALPATHVLVRGNPHVLGPAVEPGALSVLPAIPVAIVPPAGGESCGARLAFARWLFDPANPLPARVMANRVWQYHFGRGIVRTSSDFGFQGSPPTHPELLDWLATEFVRGGWRLKALHRQIMLSASYQMSSQFNPQADAVDPANDLLWRFDMRRLSAEEIRDSILAASGSLNLETMFGPSVFTELAPEVLAGQSRPGDGWGNSSERDRSRRSVYIHVKRSLKDPNLQNFDAAETDFSCPVRFVTTQPTQALGMLNGAFANQQAGQLAARAMSVCGDDLRRQVGWIVRETTQREADSSEIERGERFVRDLQGSEGLAPADALRYFCLVALNTNEFIYLD